MSNINLRFPYVMPYPDVIQLYWCNAIQIRFKFIFNDCFVFGCDLEKPPSNSEGHGDRLCWKSVDVKEEEEAISKYVG